MEQQAFCNCTMYEWVKAFTAQDLQDLLNCLVLSETSYKVADMGRRRATEMINRIRQTFPQGIITTERVQWSLSSVFHRFFLRYRPAACHLNKLSALKQPDSRYSAIPACCIISNRDGFYLDFMQVYVS